MAGAQRTKTINISSTSPLPSNFCLAFESRDNERVKLHRFIRALYFSTENFAVSVPLHSYYDTLAFGMIIGLSGEPSCDVTCHNIRRYPFSRVIEVLDNWKRREQYWTIFWKPKGVTMGTVGRLETLEGAIEWLTKTNPGGFI